jgi:hypothetical protein
MDLFPPTLHDQIREVEAEIAMRRKVYPRLVDSGRMSQKQADRKMELMQAILATLNTVASIGVVRETQNIQRQQR